MNASQPEPMTHPEKEHIRAMAFKAQRLYPGPVGAVLFRHILDWEEFGYRYAQGSDFGKLISHLNSINVPQETS